MFSPKLSDVSKQKTLGGMDQALNDEPGEGFEPARVGVIEGGEAVAAVVYLDDCNGSGIVGTASLIVKIAIPSGTGFQLVRGPLKRQTHGLEADAT